MGIISFIGGQVLFLIVMCLILETDWGMPVALLVFIGMGLAALFHHYPWVFPWFMLGLGALVTWLWVWWQIKQSKAEKKKAEYWAFHAECLKEQARRQAQKALEQGSESC